MRMYKYSFGGSTRENAHSSPGQEDGPGDRPAGGHRRAGHARRRRRRHRLRRAGARAAARAASRGQADGGDVVGRHERAAAAAAGNGLRASRARRGGHPGRAARVVPRVLSDRRAPGARAARRRGAHRGDRHRRREVGHLRRRQGAERPHAFLGEPRERLGLRRLLAPAQRRGREGARGRVSRRGIRAAHRRRPARDQARRAHELLRHRLEGGRRAPPAGVDRGARQPRQGSRGPGRAEPQYRPWPRRADGPALMASKPRFVVKLGGELLEQPDDLARVATGIAVLAQRTSLVVVHGGGREIDAALATAGIPKQQVDGLRVTDPKTLDVVVAVLAGAINTRLVAALRKAGARPVGLTGADASVATMKRSHPIASVAGPRVDLGLVGSPINNGSPQLLTDLLARGYVPVVACIGATRDGQLLNVNADTLAAHLASSLGARRLVIAGGTSGVLDEAGQTIQRLDSRGAARMIKAGTANKGMVAKLEACRAALRRGVGDVVIANGREVPLETLAATKGPLSGCTQVVP